MLVLRSVVGLALGDPARSLGALGNKLWKLLAKSLDDSESWTP